MKIDKIRVSIGSATALGLENKAFNVAPTTCYMMTYREGRCSANCSFCPQARSAKSSTERLSRIQWPEYNFGEVLTKLKYATPLKKFRRMCIQTLNYPESTNELIEIVRQIRKVSNIPISVAITPLPKEDLKKLKKAGVERVGIALDGATEKIFNKIKGEKVKGPYRWESHLEGLKSAVKVFEPGNVSTHLIVGLGESNKEILEMIEYLNDKNILVGLFAFTPIKGTLLEGTGQPNLVDFRKTQLARYLVMHKDAKAKQFVFNSKGALIKFNIDRQELREIIEETSTFETSGCPGCNRPNYTSRPSGPIYNYPKELNVEEKEEVFKMLENFVN